MRNQLTAILFSILLSLSLKANSGVPASNAPWGESGSDSLYLDSIARLFRIDEIEVVARQEKDVTPPQRLRGEQLHALATTSVADAVRYFSGIQLKDYGGVGGMKTVDLRSMGSQHLAVFYDGIAIGNAQNGIVDLGKFSMDNLEEVALYNGQKSEIFQPARDFGSAGTLYLKTKRPKFSHDKTYNVEVKMRGGTFGLANPSVIYEQRLSDNIHISANAEYTYATGRYHFHYRKELADGSVAWDTTAVRENGDVQAFRAEAGLFGYTERGKWHVKGYYYQSERGIPGAIVNNVWKNSQRQWDRNAFVQVNYTTSVGKRTDLQVNAKYANDKLRYLNPDTTLMYIDNLFLQQQVYMSASARWRLFPFWDIAAAADYDLNWLKANLTDFSNPIRHTVLVSAATAVSYKWLKAQASVLETYVKDKVPSVKVPSTTKNTYNAVTPAVFVNVKPILHEEWFIRGFYKMVYRMPTFNDLYYTDVGSSNLKPEKTRQYDLGSEWSRLFATDVTRLRSVETGLKADAYFNQVENKIVAIPKGNSQYRWMMLNLGYVEITGAELSADLRFRFRTTTRPTDDLTLYLHASYTFQQALDKTNPDDNDQYGGTYKGQVAYIPRHSGSATGTLLWRGLTASYSFVYVGQRFTSSANIPANIVQPWYTHDLAASWTIPVSQNKTANTTKIQIGLEINNIFNQQYEVIPNYPMPGINGKGIIRVII